MKKEEMINSQFPFKHFVETLVYELFEGINSSNALQEEYFCDLEMSIKKQGFKPDYETSIPQMQPLIAFSENSIQRVIVDSLKVSLKTKIVFEEDKSNKIKGNCLGRNLLK